MEAMTKINFNNLKANVGKFFSEYLRKVSSNTLGAVSILMLHLSTMPSLITVLLGKSDRLPTLDVVIFIWAALVSLFFKSLLEKNFFYIILICLGFLSQTIIMSLILFK
jgi:hypothetical protein